MKQLSAVLLALTLVLIPFAAQADSVSLWAQMPAQNNESHHFKLHSLKSLCSIPQSDQLAYCTAAMSGFIDQAGSSHNVAIGVIEFDTGPGIYFWTSGFPTSSFIAKPGCLLQSAWGNTGCILYTPSLTHDSEIDIEIELDYYPASSSNPAEWEAWFRDYNNAFTPLGIILTSTDWFSYITMRHGLHYYGATNPWYLMDAVWEDPFTWTGGYGWTSFTPPYPVGISYTNSADADFCNNGYMGFMGIPTPRTWGTGSVAGFPFAYFCPPGWVG